jgi:hypothetical protein
MTLLEDTYWAAQIKLKQVNRSTTSACHVEKRFTTTRKTIILRVENVFQSWL